MLLSLLRLLELRTNRPQGFLVLPPTAKEVSLRRCMEILIQTRSLACTLTLQCTSAMSGNYVVWSHLRCWHDAHSTHRDEAERDREPDARERERDREDDRRGLRLRESGLRLRPPFSLSSFTLMRDRSNGFCTQQP